MIPWLSFERWSHAGGRWFSADRVYLKTWGIKRLFTWTPIVLLYKRYGKKDA